MANIILSHIDSLIIETEIFLDEYSYESFYEASTEKKCDIFRCIENGKVCSIQLRDMKKQKRRKELRLLWDYMLLAENGNHT